MFKILYVEDTENNRILVTRRLQKLQYQVLTAADAESGLALAAGCDEYETKPFDFPSLVQKIETLLAARTPPMPGSPAAAAPPSE